MRRTVPASHGDDSETFSEPGDAFTISCGGSAAAAFGQGAESDKADDAMTSPILPNISFDILTPPGRNRNPFPVIVFRRHAPYAPPIQCYKAEKCSKGKVITDMNFEPTLRSNIVAAARDMSTGGTRFATFRTSFCNEKY